MDKKGLFCICAAFCLLAPPSAQADHSWGDYHWARTSNPFTINLSDQLDSSWDGHLAAASADWTVSSVLDTPVIGTSCGSRSKGNPRKGGAGCVAVQNGAYGRTGWLGVATISLDSRHHIVSGSVKVNDTYLFDDASRKNGYNNPEARQHVICQEIGHTLGLDHQFTNAGSCMDYAGLTLASYTHPNQHDYDQLEIVYAHLDGGGHGPSAAVKRLTWTIPVKPRRLKPTVSELIGRDADPAPNVGAGGPSSPRPHP